MQNNLAELLALLAFMLPRTFPPPLLAAFDAADGRRRAAAHVDDAQVRRQPRYSAPDESG